MKANEQGINNINTLLDREPTKALNQRGRDCGEYMCCSFHIRKQTTNYDKEIRPTDHFSGEGF